MAIEERHHAQYVDSWLARRASPRTSARIAELLVGALEALAGQGRGVLGDVTHDAMQRRILEKAQFAHPCLRVLPSRAPVRREARLALTDAATADELHAATRFVVADHLRALSLFTAGILTTRLYEKLGGVGEAEVKR